MLEILFFQKISYSYLNQYLAVSLLHNKSSIEIQIFNGASPLKFNQGSSARKQKKKITENLSVSIFF
jgi:hypothetical protein